MIKPFLFTLLAALMNMCDSRTLDQQTGYPLAITTPVVESNGWRRPTYCDSVRMDGYCVNYWRDGYQGRICGEYTVYPIIQPQP